MPETISLSYRLASLRELRTTAPVGWYRVGVYRPGLHKEIQELYSPHEKFYDVRQDKLVYGPVRYVAAVREASQPMPYGALECRTRKDGKVLIVVAEIVYEQDKDHASQVA